MRDLDLLLITVYFIIVVYVLYQAFRSLENTLENQFDIQTNPEALKQQILDQKLQELINLKVDIKKRYEFNKFTTLPIVVENKTKTTTVLINWDYSSMTDFDGNSRRILHLIPGVYPEPRQQQFPSVAPPGVTLKEVIAVADSLETTPEGKLIQKPLINVGKFKDLQEKRKPCQFSLRIIVQLTDPLTGGGMRTHALTCQFTLASLHWTEALPWNQKPAFPRKK
ncbi:hypothetical protein [Geitlerinema sp. PCC 7407]|uniref:hypothetical protein n=1 Tax=Geitlerinema sp. PCC 7407 TaxID=1173025 RepID=UPI00029FE2A9|nr:hypothetical protein [Geitlerinema sp. PCC 7407]AFY65235.1 hypothetical protein GEI7407_0737 [Geitlerinema sp. PCC 7407]